MNKLLFLLLLVLLNSCSSNYELKDNEIIELPINLTEGYGPFYAGFGIISWRQHPEDSDWGKTRVDITGIPEKWRNPVVQQIWFDAHQFAYQNFKQGKISESFFNELRDAWNINLSTEILSEAPIKCFTHIVMQKDADGNIVYKIDKNNNKDFSDETEEVPLPMNWKKMDSLSQYAHIISAETFINGKIMEIEVPVLILISDRGDLLKNFPQYAKTEFLGNQINISSGFSNLTFKEGSSICIGDSVSEKTREVIKKDEFINIDGSIFQNLGVDFNRQILQLKKMPADSILFSTQVGFLAKPFEGKDFITQDSISLKGYSGKYLFLEFWGTWCAPCVQEIPNLKTVYENIDKERISFLGIAQDNPESLKKFLIEKEIRWEQILSENDNNLVDLYGINAFPTSFLIDDKGKIVAKNLRGENLLDTLNCYLN